MRQLHKKILAAAVMCASLLISISAYGAQKIPVVPDADAISDTGDLSASVGENVTVSIEKDSSPDNGSTHSGQEQSSSSDSNESEYVNAGPGAKKEEADTTEGESLGMFTITGYCNCSVCSGGHNKTFSGTVPQPGHTISADLNVFPLGTRLLIDGVTYTVEDKGSAVVGNKLDIFYGSHEEALAKGTYKAEVFSAD